MRDEMEEQRKRREAVSQPTTIPAPQQHGSLINEGTKEPEQEPVGEAYLCDSCNTPFDGAYECPSCGHNTATKEPVYTTPPQRKEPEQEPVASSAKDAIMGAAYDFRDAHFSGSRNLKQSAHAALESAVEAALAQPEQEMVSKARYNRMRDDYNDLLKQSQQDAKDAKEWRRHVTHCQLQGVDLDHSFAQPAVAEQHKQEPTDAYPTDEHGYPIYSNGTHADIAKAHAEFEARFEPESIWIGTGHLREILNGNTLNAYCSPEQDRFTDVRLYTTPPQRKPMTYGQIRDLWARDNGLEDCDLCKIDDFIAAVRFVEAAHGIKE